MLSLQNKSPTSGQIMQSSEVFVTQHPGGQSAENLGVISRPLKSLWVLYHFEVGEMSSEADFILFGGDIITMDNRNPTVEALAIKGDKILATGNFDEVFALSGPCTQLIYLDNQTLLPGFIEPHQHAIFATKFRGSVNISGYYFDSYKDIETKMKTEIAMVDTGKGDRVKWCVFHGWDPELIPDLPILSADFLDELSRDVPIVVLAQSFHVAWVNHKAFEVKTSNNFP